MQTVAIDLIQKLKNKGINTFFGVQGGACARLIEAVVKTGGSFYPVLNEQAAGYCAHGYFLATRKTAGIIMTTGPGFTNAVSGIAACYYDNIPLIVLVGQVKKSINVASKFGTKMVGFQELPHLKIGKSIADDTYCIDSEKKYKSFLNNFIGNYKEKVSIIEVLDNVQRINVKPKIKNKKFKAKNEKNINKNIFKRLNKKRITFLLGAGFSRSNLLKKSINLINKFKVPVATTWGAQEISRNIKNNLGIFGDHSPGFASSYLEKNEYIVCFGTSLLQHQTGRSKDDFASKAKIIYINNNIKECLRAKKQFGKRLTFVCVEPYVFLNKLHKTLGLKFNKNQNDLNLSFLHKSKQNTPVKFLSSIMNCINPKNSIIFSDAGATLSWTYQAASLIKNCAPIYTAFNLHPMGYANCAAIGAACKTKKDIFVIIGDGSVPMNCQEFAWAKKFKIKFIVIDNKGYGVIRQTQKQFYKSFFLGSDFLNKKSSLPYFSVKKIFKAFDLPVIEINALTFNKSKIKKFINSKKSSTLIANIKYSEIIRTYKKIN